MNFLDLSKDSLEIGPDSKPLKTVVEGNYKYVLYSTLNALVFKGDSEEPSYEITPAGCSCPADRYRNDTCKHRKFVLSLGDESATPPVEDTLVRAKEASEELFNVDDLLM